MEIVKNSYLKILKEARPNLRSIKVKGVIKTCSYNRCDLVYEIRIPSFYVDGKEIVEKLYKAFTFNRLYDEICLKNDNGEEGVYSCYDESYHGSPSWVYNLLYKGPESIILYNALEYLYSNYGYYVEASKKVEEELEKSNVLERKIGK